MTMTLYKAPLRGRCACRLMWAALLVAVVHTGVLEAAATPALVDSGLGCNAIHPDVLIYNRVPKSGSTSMNILLRTLSRKHDFEFHKSPAYFPKADELRRDFQSVCATKRRCVYANHMDFPAPEMLQILTERNLTYALINMVRRPVSQTRSRFEYARYGFREAPKKAAAAASYSGSYNDCVHESHHECLGHGVLMRFLGHRAIFQPAFQGGEQPRVSDGSGAAGSPSEESGAAGSPMEDASAEHRQALAERLTYVVGNVKQYAVVGILEQWAESLEVLEKILPDFFAGAVEVAAQLGDNKKVTPSRSISDATKAFADDALVTKRIMYHLHFSLENVIYDYLASRFDKQAEACGVRRVSACASDEFLYYLSDSEAGSQSSDQVTQLS